ncbi:AcrR family transcriptional regulator [Rhodococcus erythropolis]|uniref:TetR family transcriptional regulator n=1 Tax=Rhodococcus erythropolis TaxID=1833 RepID=UPI002169EF98|nr:TetR family transcriptional regulator [Rhodococcus erythropolis]MCS4255686.1 AcrR family transcriptional regulator [Rhodococcus erythropolis]MCW2425199.1 AcrR family transcriptional regulator [Rhodococcus erythropolis]
MNKTSTSGGFHDEVRLAVRERALEATRKVVCARGWQAVTMMAVATDVGVSRQLLYNEFGAKSGLAEGLFERETDRFLAEVRSCLVDHANDLAAGLGSASAHALKLGSQNVLVRAIIGGPNSADAELLGLHTVQSKPVLLCAIEPLSKAICDIHRVPPEERDRIATIVEIMVRLTLSYLIQPIGAVEIAEEQLHLTARALCHVDKRDRHDSTGA